MTFSRYGNILAVNLEGTINFSNSTEIKTQIRSEIADRDRDLILNLKMLDFADSSGVGVMISLLKTITTKGGLMKICAPSEDIKFVLKMTKIDLVIPMYETIEDAIKSIEMDYSKIEK